jgi:hydrogenase maturation protease
MIHDRPPWEELERRGPDAVEVDGVAVRAGSVVRLAPRRTGGDIFEDALAGRSAVVHEVLQDLEGRIQLAVTVTDDPGQDLGALRRPGHRFFLAPDEVQPVDMSGVTVTRPVGPRVLVAGIGNVFLGDDGWGVALAGRIATRELPPGVDVADFGIRGMDLAFAMADYEAVILLDATPRGERAGTLYVIEADPGEGEGGVDAHGMDPVRVLALARTLGDGPVPRTFVVGCEPHTHMTAEDEHIVAELTEPVRAALEPAVALVEDLLADLTRPDPEEGP